MARREIPHLVFSTRSPEPRSGSDFVREVVAESPGVSEAARRDFARRADIAGSVLHHPLPDHRRPLLFSFNPLPDGTWLFARAVSLGLYRKGSHHLLIHGAVLGPEEMECLDGNPLLLELPEVRRKSGFTFVESHPGAGAQLPPLTLDSRIAGLCRRLGRERLESLADPAWEPWLPAAYDALAGGERLACALSEPRPERVEWLLLHLHPEDRLEVSFHTFYSYDRGVDVRLLLLLPEDVPQVQGQLRPLRLMDLTSGMAPPAPAAGLGELAARLRRRTAVGYLEALAEVQLTHVSRRSRPPLSPADARLSLRAALGESLSAEEQERHALLRQRGRRGLGYHVSHLAAEWQRRPEGLPRALARIAETQEGITREEVAGFLDARLPHGLDDWGERWVLAALLAHDDALEPDGGWEVERRSAWSRLVPVERFRELLESFNAGQAVLAEDLLLSYSLAALPAPYWQRLLPWLDERGRALEPAIEELEAALPGLSAPAARESFQKLGELCRRLGRPREALRLLLARELPLLDQAAARSRLDQAAARSRLDQAVELAWAGGDQGQDALLAASLGEPRVAAAVLEGLADWLSHRPDESVATAWRRAAALLEAASELSPQAAAPCGALLAALAASPLEGRAAEALELARRKLPEEADAGAFATTALARAAAPLAARCEEAAGSGEIGRLVAAAADLLDARCRHDDARAADGALMRLGVRGKVLAAEAGARWVALKAVRRLARTWPGFLRAALHGGLFDRAGEESREDALPEDALREDALEWLGLLADELYAERPHNQEEDSRYQAFLRLAWACWGREAQSGRPRLAGVKIHQALGWGQLPASRAWHRELLQAVVPEPWREAALEELALSLAAHPQPRAGEGA